MRYFLPLLAFVVLVLSSCSIESQNNKETTSGGGSGSYQAWVRVNGSLYLSNGIENDGEYRRDEKIGSVKYNLPADQSIQENFASNYLEEGADLFSVQDEEPPIILGETEEGTYEIMKEQRN